MRRTLHPILLASLIFLALTSSACLAVAGPAATDQPTPDTAATIQLMLTEGAATAAAGKSTATLEQAAPTEAAPTQAAPTQAAPTQAATTQAATSTIPPAAPTSTQPFEPLKPTVTAISVPTAVRTATATATSVPPTAAPTRAPAVALPAGWQVFRHPLMPGFVFPADPRIWKQVNNPNWKWQFLVLRSDPYCGINPTNRSVGTPERLLRWQLGRLRWRVLDYGPDALARMDKPAGLFVDLFSFDNAKCRQAELNVLEWVMLEDELNGNRAYDPLPTPTVRPPLPGFSCPNTPPVRLRVDDHAWIVTNDLLLRSKPQPSADTRIRVYDASDPVLVHVIGGPVCTEKFVYWNVSVNPIRDEYVEPSVGWLAEGDLSEYYLEPTE